MTDTVQQDEIAELTTMFKQFADHLPNKLNYIETLCNRLQTQISDDLLSELQLKVHSLSGTCGTFGYIHLGNAAKKLDFLLKDIQGIKKESADLSKILAQAKILKKIFLSTVTSEAFDVFLKVNVNT